MKLVIFQSVDREGACFTLSGETSCALTVEFGDKFKTYPRVFIAHEEPIDLSKPFRLRESKIRSLISILTGLDYSTIDGVKSIEFVDPIVCI